MFTRKLTWGHKLSKFLHKRFLWWIARISFNFPEKRKSNADLKFWHSSRNLNLSFYLDPDQGLSDGVCQRHHVLQGGQRYTRHLQRGRLQRLGPSSCSDHSEERAGNSNLGRNSLAKRINRQGNEGNVQIKIYIIAHCLNWKLAKCSKPIRNNTFGFSLRLNKPI